MAHFGPCLKSRLWIWSPELAVLDSSCLTSGFLGLALWHTLLTRLKALGPTLLLAQGLVVGVVASGLLL